MDYLHFRMHEGTCEQFNSSHSSTIRCLFQQNLPCLGHFLFHSKGQSEYERWRKSMQTSLTLSRVQQDDKWSLLCSQFLHRGIQSAKTEGIQPGWQWVKEAPLLAKLWHISSFKLKTAITLDLLSFSLFCAYKSSRFYFLLTQHFCCYWTSIKKTT